MCDFGRLGLALGEQASERVGHVGHLPRLHVAHDAHAHKHLHPLATVEHRVWVDALWLCSRDPCGGARVHDQEELRKVLLRSMLRVALRELQVLDEFLVLVLLDEQARVHSSDRELVFEAWLRDGRHGVVVVQVPHHVTIPRKVATDLAQLFGGLDVAFDRVQLSARRQRTSTWGLRRGRPVGATLTASATLIDPVGRPFQDPFQIAREPALVHTKRAVPQQLNHPRLEIGRVVKVARIAPLLTLRPDRHREVPALNHHLGLRLLCHLDHDFLHVLTNDEAVERDVPHGHAVLSTQPWIIPTPVLGGLQQRRKRSRGVRACALLAPLKLIDRVLVHLRHSPAARQLRAQ